MRKLREKWWVFLLLLAGAAAFRLSVARFLPNDTPGDSVTYAQLARNLLEQHVYSAAAEPPYVPTLIRLPGYPLFVASVYALFGHTNNAAVRIAQALLDTISCGLVALLAFQWEPDQRRKWKASMAALALAAVCPFPTIYVATILTECGTTLLAVAMCLTATLAFAAKTSKDSLAWWFTTGILAGGAVLFRPDSGLFAAAIGITLVVAGLRPFWSAPAKRGDAGALDYFAPLRLSARESFSQRRKDRKEARVNPKRRLRGVLPAHSIVHSLSAAAVFSLAFALMLLPWTIRNARVFHLFQPLAPAHGEMPGEFVPRGYQMWLRTWLDDLKYVGPTQWALDENPITLDQLPASAFDSSEEKDRVAALLDRYNQDDSGAEDSENGGAVEMTPEIDAGFASVARERIARHPLRYYVWLPAKRAASLWFDTHSEYWPFAGELFPLEGLDHQIHQHIWLPLFAALDWIYTLLGVTGGYILWRSRAFSARRWLLLATLMIFLRLGFFSTVENPEPRYVVELFPFVAALGGIAVAQLVRGTG